MNWARLAFVVLFLASASVPVGVSALRAGDGGAAVEVEARSVTTRFFRTLNARDYEQTCALLSNGYFRRHGSERRHCALGLRVGYLWSQEIRWRIVSVEREGDRVMVLVFADGDLTRLVLGHEAMGLRVLAVGAG